MTMSACASVSTKSVELCVCVCVCVCVCARACEHKTCDIVCESVNTKRDIVCVCTSVSTKRVTLSMCESVSTSATMSVVVACKDFTEGKIRDRCTFRIHGKQNPPKTHRLLPGTHLVQTTGKLQMANRKLAFRHNDDKTTSSQLATL